MLRHQGQVGGHNWAGFQRFCAPLIARHALGKCHKKHCGSPENSVKTNDAIGGFSGSGKSTLPFGLAPLVGALLGATVFAADEIRKRLCEWVNRLSLAAKCSLLLRQ
jgi:hypothetical protein